MKNLHKLRVLILIIIIIEIIVVVFIIKSFKEKTKVKGISVNKIKKDTIFYNPLSKLNYFYEYSPGQNIKQEKFFWLTEDVEYSINLDALNDRFEYQTKKPLNTYRIMTLGDSFTFGMFVNTKNNWTETLEDLLNTNIQTCKSFKRFEVINLGIPGYDIQYSVERYKIRGQKYKPDLIILLLKDDDFTEISELMRKNESRYILEMKKNGEWESLMKKGNPYPPQAKLLEDMEKIRKKMENGEFEKILYSHLEDLANAVEGKLMIITFPYLKNSYKQIMRNVVKIHPNTSYYETVNIYSLNNTAFLPYDAHPNKKGHKIIAEDLYSHLAKNKIVPCD